MGKTNNVNTDHQKSYVDSPTREDGTAVEILGQQADPVAQLKFWEMKGLTTITAIEDDQDFDFVISGNCSPVLVGGKFVTVAR